MPYHRLTISIVLFALAGFALLSTACSPEAIPSDTPTPTVLVITATLAPTQTPRPSATPAPPSPTAPVNPVEGQTTSQLNVRSAPSAESEQIGSVQIFEKVQIVGKDPTGTWWLIVFPDSPTGTGWITAQFVQVTGTEDVPVFNSPPQTANGTPDPVTTAETGASSTVPSAAPGSAPAASPQPSQPLASAFEDGDSAQAPAVSIALSKASVRSFHYNSDLSSPQGDPEDWIQFRLEGAAEQPVTVSVVFHCTGSGAWNVELLQNNTVLQGWQDLTCGQPRQLLLNLFVGAPYTLHLAPSPGNDLQKYIDYTLNVNIQ